ncbi:MAG: hypothetical protein AUK31_01690 [Fibrobacteres bacterium CG2_30_45_31]|nr:MAG: hypothetical protein AUK31_01690 [Fibrobacteres bacterium CG2_30_45_31]
MVLFSYIITRDYGFAPNPFPPYCTLATCKPFIREHANSGDWILGFGSAAKGGSMKGRLVYAMQVQGKLTFDQYWNDSRFFYKRPVMNGSKKQRYGDNIYHTDERTKFFIQEDSHHSLQNGLVNKDNYTRDLRSKYVLISQKYWYWGKDAVRVPSKYQVFIHKGIGQKKVQNDALILNFVTWLESMGSLGYIGAPFKFQRDFERYNGK